MQEVCISLANALASYRFNWAEIYVDLRCLQRTFYQISPCYKRKSINSETLCENSRPLLVEIKVETKIAIWIRVLV